MLRLNFKNLKTLCSTKKILRHKMRRIQAKKHTLGTYEINKISLACFDDTRSVLKDGIHSLAFIKILEKKIKSFYEILTDKCKRFSIKKRNSHR